MNAIILLLFQFSIFKFQCSCNMLFSNDVVDRNLEIYNEELREFNQISAELAWNFSTNLNQSEEFLAKTQDLLLKKNLWNNEWCLNLLQNQEHLGVLDISKKRQIYLICRGPRYSSYQLSNILTILGNLRTTYDTLKICIEGNCYRMEPDLNNFMESTRNELQLKHAWTLWHKTIGNELAPAYIELVQLMNLGAKQAGHTDIGSLWRDEMEDSDLIKDSLNLYGDVKYLFSLLHTYVRFKLGEHYKLDLNGKPIPAHLLGNMWSQRWDSLIDLIWPEEELDKTKSSFIVSHISKNASVMDMVKWAENYYIDMGFPKLPTKFYENSYFENKDSSTNNKNCHGSAANMYAPDKDDFRIMLCANVKDSDLQTIVHEMGHIHYFMAYKNQPTIFQDGANSGFHEAVGDAVTYGMWTNPNLRQLLKIALAKLPQISFGLIVDLWRWKIFEVDSNPKLWNEYWWKLNYEFLGIVPPEGYVTNGLDALGKYHIVDNIPYIRYYYASFLQHMFYDEMCKTQPYCSLKGKGNKFREMLRKGTSQHWSRILYEFTGEVKVSVIPLLKYFKPLQNHLEREVVLNNLDLDWN